MMLKPASPSLGPKLKSRHQHNTSVSEQELLLDSHTQERVPDLPVPQVFLASVICVLLHAKVAITPAVAAAPVAAPAQAAFVCIIVHFPKSFCECKHPLLLAGRNITSSRHAYLK